MTIDDQKKSMQTQRSRIEDWEKKNRGVSYLRQWQKTQSRYVQMGDDSAIASGYCPPLFSIANAEHKKMLLMLIDGIIEDYAKRVSAVREEIEKWAVSG